MLNDDANKKERQFKINKKVRNGYDAESSINFNGKDGYNLQKRIHTKAHFVTPPIFTMIPALENDQLSGAEEAWHEIAEMFKNEDYVIPSGPKKQAKEKKKKKNIANKNNWRG